MKGKSSFLSKYLRFFVSGLVILLVIELGGLIFLDRSYLQEKTGDVKVQQITKGVKSKTPGIKVSFDESAKKIKASYDGNYLAYTVNGELVVLNLLDGTKNTVKMASGMALGYYKWVYDRDQLIIAEMSQDDDSDYYALLYNLNVREAGAAPVEIRNTVNNTKAKIVMPSKSYQVSDIDFSTSTVTTYLKLTSKYGKSVLWKFNVPSENSAYSSISTKKIGNIQCLKNESELLYENGNNGKVCMAGEGSIHIGDQDTFRLLGYDRNDNVYLAKGNAGATNEIYYGSLLKESDTGDYSIDLTPDMKTVVLPQSVSNDDIHVTLSGGIYLNEADKKAFKNLLTGKEISYHGEVKAVYGKGFITVDNGVILQNSLE